MTIAITRMPAASIAKCELTFIDRVPIDYAKFKEQHRAYCEALEACDVKVVRLAAADDLPDSVFVEDTAIILDEVAIITNPGAISRRTEIDSIAEVLAQYRTLIYIKSPATVDGGDVLVVGKVVYVGLSSRSNSEAIGQMQTQLAEFGYPPRHRTPAHRHQ